MMKVALLVALAAGFVAAKPKNFIMIYADDSGLGDLSAFGQPCRDPEQCPGTFAPNLNAMAKEGITFTNWYAPHCICSPSRASLNTGRYPIRTTVYPGVFSPQDAIGLPTEEITFAKILQEHGYSTGLAGKWHLGQMPPFIPINHGYDQSHFLPQSHDYCPCPCSLTLTEDCTCRPTDPPCPLFQDYEVIQQPAFLPNLTHFYAESAIQFMTSAVGRKSNFAFMMTPQHTHHPQFRTSGNINASADNGGRPDAFGDAYVGLDQAVGDVLNWVRDQGLQDDTLVFYSADNGPSLPRGSHFCGSAGGLNCGKFSTWEGGQRIGGIAWGGGITPGQYDGIVSSFDVFPTFLNLAGAPVPTDRIIDGKDLSPILFDGSKEPHHANFTYYGLHGKVSAVRVGDYKVHLSTSSKGSPNASLSFLCGPPAGQKDGEHATFNLTSGKIEGSPWVFNVVTDAGERDLIDPSSAEYATAVGSAEKVLREMNCYAVGDPGCDASPKPTCKSNVSLPIFPSCDIFKDPTCKFEPYNPSAECKAPPPPGPPSSNCTFEANTRQDSSPYSQGHASSQDECCGTCLGDSKCAVAVYLSASGGCNLHAEDGHGVAEEGATSCHSGRGSIREGNQAWVVRPNAEYLAGLTEYDLM